MRQGSQVVREWYCALECIIGAEEDGSLELWRVRRVRMQQEA